MFKKQTGNKQMEREIETTNFKQMKKLFLINFNLYNMKEERGHC